MKDEDVSSDMKSTLRKLSLAPPMSFGEILSELIREVRGKPYWYEEKEQ